MIVIEKDMNEFNKIKKQGYIELFPIYLCDENGNRYPHNINKLISKNEIKKLTPIFDEKNNELLNRNCNVCFKIDTGKNVFYYVAKTGSANYEYSVGKAKILIENIKKVNKKEYKSFCGKEHLKQELKKVGIFYIKVNIEQLLIINKKLQIVIANSDDVIKHLEKGFLIIRSLLSGEYYHFEIASYDILSNKKIKVVFAEPIRLIKQDYKYLKKATENNDVNKGKCYKTRHEGRGAVSVKIKHVFDKLTLRLNKTEVINMFNNDIRNGMIKFLFCQDGIKKRISSINIKCEKNYNEYTINFYGNSDEKQEISDYLQLVEKKEKLLIYGQDDEIVGTYYRIANKKIKEKPTKKISRLTHNNEQNVYFIDELQIIDSNNNHVTKKHKVVHRTFNIRVRESKYELSSMLINYEGHYCQQCKKYFDFKNSFILQMNEKKIPITKIETRLVNDFGKKIAPDQIRFDFYNHESVLHSYGYKVGKTGKTTLERHSIIRKVIIENILSVSEVKFILSRNISQFKNNNRYTDSINAWKEDLKFIDDNFY